MLKPKKQTLKRKRDQEAFDVGEKVGDTLDFDEALPKVKFPKKLKRGALKRFFKKDDTLKTDKQIGSGYRRAYKAQDELFSTALTREVVKGIVDSSDYTTLSAAESQHITDLVDLASSVRIPTIHSGFATKDEVMQHPANRGKALFADPYDTVSLHSKLDTERREYVVRAMNKAASAGKTGEEVLIEGVKASIEFTLNYFTAPITADDVLPFTRSSALKPADKRLQAQLRSRENMKIRYEELGGDLRALANPETQAQSRSRPWNSERSPAGEALIAPPSPRRQVLEIGII